MYEYAEHNLYTFAKKNNYNFKQRLQIANDILNGLGYLRKINKKMENLKPSNVLIKYEK
jgi:serine/threonine protein kinase